MPTGTAAMRLAGALLGLTAATQAGSQRAPVAPAPAATIVIEAVSFRPADLTVRRGAWVQWVNKDPFPHTVVAAGRFDSGSIAAGASWRYHAATAGTFAYTCTLHPNMHGTLRVQ